MGKKKQVDRALAHIEKIEWIKPIEGADNIVLIGVLGWVCIAKKDEFEVGDKCVYIEIDSLCPSNDERFEFLAKKKYKVKTMKLNKFGVISQGLALPVTDFPEVHNKKIGDDVTKELKITYYSEDDRKRKSSNKDTKYNNMISRIKKNHPKFFNSKMCQRLIRKKWGRKLLFVFFGKKKDKPLEMPSFVKRTDESRVENCPWLLESDKSFVVTEKLDGSSATYYVSRKSTKSKKVEFGVCSRNIRQLSPQQEEYHQKVGGAKVNTYWEMAEKYHIKDVLTDELLNTNCKYIILQGEIIGESIQGNPYKLKGRDFYAFNLYYEDEREGTLNLYYWADKHNINCVPILDKNYELPSNMEDVKTYADDYSVVNPEVKREGVVCRTKDGKISFKNVSREYLLKHS